MTKIMSRLEDILSAVAFTDAGEFGKALELVFRHWASVQGDVS